MFSTGLSHEPLQRDGDIEPNPVNIVTVSDHAVRVARAGTLAELAGDDHQIFALIAADVVFQQISQRLNINLVLLVFLQGKDILVFLW